MSRDRDGGRTSIAALAAWLACAAVACSSSVGPSPDADRETGPAIIDASDEDIRADDAAVDVTIDAPGVPCSDITCAPGQICVHQGFMEDGGFRECDRACASAPATRPGSCATWGADYCRLACFSVTDEAIYCLCD